VNFFEIGEYFWRSYKQERDCLMHFVRLANTLLNDGESARSNHVLACNFAKYSPIKKTQSQTQQRKGEGSDGNLKEGMGGGKERWEGEGKNGKKGDGW